MHGPHFAANSLPTKRPTNSTIRRLGGGDKNRQTVHDKMPTRNRIGRFAGRTVCFYVRQKYFLSWHIIFCRALCRAFCCPSGPGPTDGPDSSVIVLTVRCTVPIYRFRLWLLGEHQRDALAARWLGSGSLITGANISQTNVCKFVLRFVVEASPKGGGAAIVNA